MPALSGRDRRAITIGTMVLAPAFALAYGVIPFVGALAARRVTAVGQMDRLVGERKLVEFAARLPAVTAAARLARDAELPRAVRGADVTTATVRLADYVRATARSHDVLVADAVAVGGDSLGGGVEVLRLSLKAESDLAGILRFLRALESGSPTVRISGVSIERARPGSAEDSRELLSLTAIVEAPLVRSTSPSPGGE